MFGGWVTVCCLITLTAWSTEVAAVSGIGLIICWTLPFTVWRGGVTCDNSFVFSRFFSVPWVMTTLACVNWFADIKFVIAVVLKGCNCGGPFGGLFDEVTCCAGRNNNVGWIDAVAKPFICRSTSWLAEGSTNVAFAVVGEFVLETEAVPINFADVKNSEETRCCVEFTVTAFELLEPAFTGCKIGGNNPDVDTEPWLNDFTNWFWISALFWSIVTPSDFVRLYIRAGITDWESNSDFGLNGGGMEPLVGEFGADLNLS